MNLRCTRGALYEYQDLDNQRKYFSVSQVLLVLDPDAFAGVDPFVLAAAQERGKDLHTLFGLRLLSMSGIGAAPARPSGIIGCYYDAIDRFVSERKPRPRKVEQASVNDKDGYAGTADTECLLDNRPDIWTIDLKSGLERAVHSAQLIGGYKHLQGYERSKRFASLYIRKNGTYSLVEHTHNHIDRAWFLAGLTVLNGRRHHGIR